MNKKRQQNIIEWAIGALVLLIYLYVFFQIGKTFCQIDNEFCGYVGLLVAAFIAGIIWYLRYGNRR